VLPAGVRVLVRQRLLLDEDSVAIIEAASERHEIFVKLIAVRTERRIEDDGRVGGRRISKLKRPHGERRGPEIPSSLKRHKENQWRHRKKLLDISRITD